MENSAKRISYSKRHGRRLRRLVVDKTLKDIEEDSQLVDFLDDLSQCTAPSFITRSGDISNTLSAQSNLLPADGSHETGNDDSVNYVDYNCNSDNDSDYEIRLSAKPVQEFSSDSDSDDDVSHDIKVSEEVSEIKLNLREWALDNNVTHNALSQLLKILQPRVPGLPQDARTLLRTPRHVEVTEMDNGQLYYFGLQRGLAQALKSGVVSHETNVIKLDFNVDGLSLFDSSFKSLWPILCRSLSLKDQTPFVIALFCGTTKPQPLDLYLEKFIAELQSVIENGIMYENKLFQIEIRCFICDAPARAMLKIVSGHGSSFGCERCFSKAKCVDHKLFHPVNKTVRDRKDSDFRCEDTSTNEHIRGKSPLLKLKVKLVSQFPLDPMHLIFLGVMRRLLILFWLRGKKSRRKHKLQPKLKRLLNYRIQCIIRPNMTYEFPRKPRHTEDIHLWKATEFRMFLLYYGPIVLCDILSDEKYQHFLLLHVAITILCSRTLIAEYLRVAEGLLEKFVSSSASIYGPDFVVYNVHSLIHVCNDARLYGPLGDFSSFPFENYMSTLNRFVRGRRLPLQQVANRLAEVNSLHIHRSYVINSTPEYKPHRVTQKSDTSFVCEFLTTKRFKLSIYSPNNVVAVGKKVCEIHSITCIDGQYKIIAKPYKYMYNLYRTPIPSSEIGIYFVKKFDHSRTFFVDEVSYKCVRFPFKDGFAIIPILHQTDKD